MKRLFFLLSFLCGIKADAVSYAVINDTKSDISARVVPWGGDFFGCNTPLDIGTVSAGKRVTKNRPGGCTALRLEVTTSDGRRVESDVSRPGAVGDRVGRVGNISWLIHERDGKGPFIQWRNNLTAWTR